MHNMVLGNKIIQLNKVGSTNTFARQLLEKDPNIVEGTVVSTTNQEKGRGQRGKAWESEKGKNLTFSIILFPDFIAGDDQFLISKTVALGIWDFLNKTLHNKPGTINKRITIKWPNDVYVNDQKIGGVLIENSITRQTITQSVVGIGINVNQDSFSSNLVNPTSLALEAGAQFDLNGVLMDLLCCIDRMYKQVKSGHRLVINENYLNALYQFKEWRFYLIKGIKTHARIVAVSDIGELVLENKEGNTFVCDNNILEYYFR